MDTGKPRRIGRPPKVEGQRKRSNLTMRTRGDLREKLEAAAAKSGYSLTEEVEARIARSFEDQDGVLLKNMFGSVEAAKFMQAMASAFTLAEVKTKKSPWDDEVTYYMGLIAMKHIIDGFIAGAHPDINKKIADKIANFVGGVVWMRDHINVAKSVEEFARKLEIDE